MKTIKTNMRHVRRGSLPVRVLRSFDAARQRSRERKIDYLFVHINKAGGKSIEAALDLPFRHATALELREMFGPEEFARRLVFTFVRNPWAKVVSHFNYRRKTGRTNVSAEAPDFNDWVRRAYRDREPALYDAPKMFMPQMDWICDDDGNLLVQFVGRLENADADFGALCEKLGVRATLPHVNKTVHKPYQEYYDAESREIIADHFARDIEQWGYAFD